MIRREPENDHQQKALCCIAFTQKITTPVQRFNKLLNNLAMMQTNYRNDRRPKRFFMIPLFVIAAALIWVQLFMLLWNAILPPLLNINQISYGSLLGYWCFVKSLFGNLATQA
jgi:hypothetical protein